MPFSSKLNHESLSYLAGQKSAESGVVSPLFLASSPYCCTYFKIIADFLMFPGCRAKLHVSGRAESSFFSTAVTIPGHRMLCNLLWSRIGELSCEQGNVISVSINLWITPGALIYFQFERPQEEWRIRRNLDGPCRAGKDWKITTQDLQKVT
jgi:hypothetical protein